MGIREDILACDDLGIKKVPCPEWGCDVFVKVMDGDARDAFEHKWLSRPNQNGDGANDTRGFKSFLVVKTTCDASGALIFKPEDMLELGKKNAAVINRLADVALVVSGMTEKDVGELEGN